MLKRKSASPYLICSLFIHLTLLLVMWWMVPTQVLLLPFRDEIEVSITHVERPPLPVKPLPVVEPAAPVVAKETKPPAPPKPKAGLNASWQTENQSVADIPKSEARGQEGLNRSRESVGNGLLQSNPIVGSPANYTAENPIAVSSPNQAIIAPRTPETDYVAPQGETKPIALGTNDALSGGSPTVNAPKIHYGSRRGDALRATGVGNSWGVAAPVVLMSEAFSFT